MSDLVERVAAAIAATPEPWTEVRPLHRKQARAAISVVMDSLPEIRALIENDIAGLRLQRDSWRAKALATPQGQETLRWAEGEAERLRGVMADPQQKGRPWEEFRAEIVAMIEKEGKR